MSTSIEKVTGIGPATATLLQNHGIHSAEDLAAKRVGDLAAINGFSSIRAAQVIEAAKQLTTAAVPDSPVLAAKPDKKDKKDKKKKKTKVQTKKSKKDEKRKSSKEKKKSSTEKGKGGKNKADGSKKKSAKKE